MPQPTDPILRRVTADLADLYGDRLEKVVLCGSRARGDARPNSDYDIAVFLTDYTDRFVEFARLDPVQADLWEDAGILINPLIFRAADYTKPTGLMHNIRTEGILL